MGESGVQKNRSLGEKHGRIFILACIFMLFLAVWLRKPMDVLAATGEECGDFLVTGGTKDVDYSFRDGVLQIHTDTPITIQNIDPSTPTEDCIEVAYGVDANITLAGVNIDVSEEEDLDLSQAALAIAENSSGKVTIRLADDTENILKSGRGHAGLEKSGEENTGTLTIEGDTGSLMVVGWACGIGGKRNEATQNITINGGNIHAEGGFTGAGIGGSSAGAARNITINGGNITAVGGNSGPGIGGHRCDIVINGGTVTATGGMGAAGIGHTAYSTGQVTIKGGDITATGGDFAAGIGGVIMEGGSDVNGITVMVLGGEVKAVGGGNAEGIHSGGDERSNSIVILGDTGIVRGNITLKEDLVLESNMTLTIEEDACLIIAGDVTLENNGTIINHGTIREVGVLCNNGTILGNEWGKEDGGITEKDEAKEPSTGDDSDLRLYTLLAFMAATGIYIIKTGERKQA